MPDGELAQLGERLVCNQEVTGSSPVFSTSLVFGRLCTGASWVAELEVRASGTERGRWATRVKRARGSGGEIPRAPEGFRGIFPPE